MREGKGNLPYHAIVIPANEVRPGITKEEVVILRQATQSQDAESQQFH